MSVLAVVVVATLAVYLGGFREEVLVEPDLVDKDLLSEGVNIVDQAWGLPARSQRLVETFVVLEVELDAQFWRPVFDSDLTRHNNFGVIQGLNQVLVALLSRRLELSLRRVEISGKFVGANELLIGNDDGRVITSHWPLQVFRSGDDFFFFLYPGLLDFADFIHRYRHFFFALLR